MDYLLPLEPDDALTFYGYLRLHNYYLYNKLHPIDKEYFKFEGCITHFFEIGMIYGEWKYKRDNVKAEPEIKCSTNLILSFKNDNQKRYFMSYLPASKKILMAEIKETTILFECDSYQAFEIGLIYKDWLNSQQSKVNEVPRETLKPENIERACKICIAVNKIVHLEAKQILELYQTLLENNL